MKQEAAVLVPVYRSSGSDLRLVLVRRSGGGIHGGQLAFPGGKRDPGDQSLLDTALREAHEEIGLGAERIEILGHLPPVDTRTTGFRVFPFLGRVVRPNRWSYAEQEVAEIIEVNVSDLASPEAHGRAIEHLRHWPKPHEVAFYRVGPHRLWGLTYRIVHPLISRLLAGEWAV